MLVFAKLVAPPIKKSNVFEAEYFSQSADWKRLREI